MTEMSAFPAYKDASFFHETSRGELRMWLAAPTVLVMSYRGYTDATFMDFIESVWERTLGAGSGKVQIFADTEHQTGFDRGFRAGMVQWNKRIVARTDTYCLLMRSRWIAIGVALVRATIGAPARHAEVTTSRDVFQSKLNAAVRRSFAALEAANEQPAAATSAGASGGCPPSSADGCDGR